MTELVGRDEVRTLLATAGLDIGDGRLDAVSEVLNSWLPAATELSRKMSASEHLETTPITVLVHPHSPEQGERS